MKYNTNITAHIRFITGFVFLSQLFLEVSGAVVRKPGFEMTVPICGLIFVIAICTHAYFSYANKKALEFLQAKINGGNND